MKVAVLGANSDLGRSIVLRAEEAGIGVTSIVSTPADLAGNGPIIIKEPFELTGEELARFHVFVDVLSFRHIKRFAPGMTPLELLHEKLVQSNCYYLGVGDCCLLYTDSSRKLRIADSDFLQAAKGHSDAPRCQALYAQLQGWSNFKWTLLCPSLVLDRHAYGKGRFELGSDVLPMGLDCSSRITLADFASALVELLKVRGHEQQCVSARAL